MAIYILPDFVSKEILSDVAVKFLKFKIWKLKGNPTAVFIFLILIAWCLSIVF